MRKTTGITNPLQQITNPLQQITNPLQQITNPLQQKLLRQRQILWIYDRIIPTDSRSILRWLRKRGLQIPSNRLQIPSNRLQIPSNWSQIILTGCRTTQTYSMPTAGITNPLQQVHNKCYQEAVTSVLSYDTALRLFLPFHYVLPTRWQPTRWGATPYSQC